MVTAIVPAAGKGARFDSKKKKLFVLLEKKPLLFYSLATLSNSSFIDDVILVVERNNVTAAERLIKECRISKVKAIIPGGRTRQDSVVLGLKKIDPLCDFVFIHDGARPFLTEELIKKVVLALKKYYAIVVGLPIADTIKKVTPSLFVKSTAKREFFWTVQTPQAFKASIIQRAYQKAKKDHFLATDSASLVERIGVPVRIIRGEPYNIKITTKDDFLLAQAILKTSNKELYHESTKYRKHERKNKYSPQSHGDTEFTKNYK